jgi:hypothetical protein
VIGVWGASEAADEEGAMLWEGQRCLVFSIPQALNICISSYS